MTDFYCVSCGKFKKTELKVDRSPSRPMCKSCVEKVSFIVDQNSRINGRTVQAVKRSWYNENKKGYLSGKFKPE